MTLGEFRKNTAALEDSVTLFMDSSESSEISEVCDSIVDDQGDLIISDYYSDEEGEDSEEEAEEA